MGGAWLSTHKWEHFLYTGDMEFLRDRAYPALKGAAQFMLSWLIPDKEGRLVTIPSISPENQFNYKGQQYGISMASTMDMAIIRNLFSACIRAHEILGIDDGFAAEITSAMKRLYPYHIGWLGQLQEWFQDWDDPTDEHRHLSHLFGLFPGSQISLEHSPQLAAAAKRSLLLRGDASTGWSMAWKINWWARLRDGEHAYNILRSGLTYINPAQNEVKMTGGGTYPNLFDAHPPFQIDGNLGGTAGITEMLMQSHDGSIKLLPALPGEWPRGRIRGIKARGNFRIDMSWRDHRLTEAVIFSGNGGNCRIWAESPLKVMETSYQKAKGDNPNPLTQRSPVPAMGGMVMAFPVALEVQKGYTMDFMTEKGKSYTLVPLE
jgi:alpha-L-fucosidase 2